ncbi:hypothetical protein CbuD7D7780_08740 [Coxiella burnetii]|uniref:Lipoprotein n=1 Tax=Coxiella burnetii (strain Dugway 5J108-111) TaxID=434922 RepID=A9KGH9_COXBN|nr:hypothetical protein [Coxiella burnetii]ABS76741.1 hypothetical protein CBUD_1690 [Coxiella burnetii Dugway 5J108-111]OYK79569.1 hypothetical protein CbuD7E6568_08725 [Coxiella burnetii]OYK81651.1 hypothetical protein CbuD7D7780_08740 [Coxiella burnetii]
MKIRIKTLLTMILMLALTGCATYMPLSQQSRTSLRSIAVQKGVQVPKEMYYRGPGSSAGALFGALGGLITAAANVDPAKKLGYYAESHHVLIAQIVRSSMIDAIKHETRYKLIDSKFADAKLWIKIKTYGFSIPHGFSDMLRPILSVQAKLVNRNGKTIWKKSSWTGLIGSGLPNYSKKDLAHNPDKIRQAWTLAANKVAKQIVQTLR